MFLVNLRFVGSTPNCVSYNTFRTVGKSFSSYRSHEKMSEYFIYIANVT